MKYQFLKPLVARFGVGWFWVSQITSVIGLISIVEDLKLWALEIAKVVRLIDQILPWIGKALMDLASLLSVVTHFWRSILYPVWDFLLGWVPLDIPDLVKDAVFVLLFLVLGRMRSEAFWATSVDRHLDLARAIVAKFSAEEPNLSIWTIDIENVLAYQKSKMGRTLSAKEATKMKIFVDGAFNVQNRLAHEVLSSRIFQQAQSRVKIAKRVSLMTLVLSLAMAFALLVEAFFTVAYWAEDRRQTHPGEIIFSGRTASSNSASVR